MAWSLQESIEYHRRQGAPGDQSALVALLREVLAEAGAVTPADLAEIAEAYGVKVTFLQAVLRRYPSLAAALAPHRLELCGGPRCAASLRALVEGQYGGRPGGVSADGRFTFRIIGCMKHCAHGPNLRWDGVLYEHADAALLRRLLETE